MMRNLKEYSKADVIEIIDLYRKHWVLWQVSSTGYGSMFKSKRDQAYGELLEKFREVDPTATRQTVIQKLHTLRNVWRRERRKVVESRSSESVYVPRLWYYDRLHFLEDQEMPVATKSDMRSELHPRKVLLIKVKEKPASDESNSEASFSSSSETPASSAAVHFPEPAAQQSSSRSLRDSSPAKPREPAVNAIHSSSFEMVGRYWAEKMKELRYDQRIFAEKLISDVFFEAAMNNLRMGCGVVPGAPRSHFSSLQQSLCADAYRTALEPVPERSCGGSGLELLPPADVGGTFYIKTEVDA